MEKFYSKNLEPKQTTIQNLLMFSKSLSSIKTAILNDKVVISLN